MSYLDEPQNTEFEIVSRKYEEIQEYTKKQFLKWMNA